MNETDTLTTPGKGVSVLINSSTLVNFLVNIPLIRVVPKTQMSERLQV